MPAYVMTKVSTQCQQIQLTANSDIGLCIGCPCCWEPILLQEESRRQLWRRTAAARIQPAQKYRPERASALAQILTPALMHFKQSVI